MARTDVTQKALLASLLSPMDLVEEGLYLGNRSGGSDKDLLAKNGIEVIVNIGAHQKTEVQDGFENHIIRLGDNPKADLTSVLPQCFSAIDDAMSKSKAVLVHCDAGASRSASVVCAWLMRKYHIDFNEALRRLREKRPCVDPNAGFQRQLQSLGF